MITVKQIVKKAGVSRSAFYNYFHDKYHLMEKLREKIISKLLAFYEPKNRMKYLSSKVVTRQICHHVFQYKNFYKHELNQHAQVQWISEMLAEKLGEVYGDKSYAIFAGYGTVGYLTHWIKSNFEMEPEEVADELLKIGFTNWAKMVKNIASH